MSKSRSYNTFFNVHTVSGIVISVILYIVFLAGAFALFMRDINHWQEAQPRDKYATNLHYEQIIELVENEGFHLENREIFIRLQDDIHNYIQVSSPALATDSTSDSLAVANFFLKIDPTTYEITSKAFTRESKYLGNFLYELHFLNQIPSLGEYVAGFAALFMLLAIITGIIIHWKKIVPMFFEFSIQNSARKLWADAHTALGVIGIPFQVMYAITGAFYALLTLVYAPVLLIVFDGDSAKLSKLIDPTLAPIEQEISTSENRNVSGFVSYCFEQIEDKVERADLRLNHFRTDSSTARLNVSVNSEYYFQNQYVWEFNLSENQLSGYKGIENSTYLESSLNAFFKLHFAAFGGRLLKVLFFVLSLLTCFVIASGVMVWLKAREKKQYEPRFAFNKNVGSIYLGSTLGLLPSIAFFFAVVKVSQVDSVEDFQILSMLFLFFWLSFTGYSFWSKNYKAINRVALLLTGILGLSIPIFSGVMDEVWLWELNQKGLNDSFFINVLWLLIGLTCLLLVVYMKSYRETKTV